MGWFAFKKSQPKKKRRTSTSRKQKPQPWDPQRTLLGLKILGVGVAIICAIAGWSFCEHRLMQYARTQAAAQRSAATPGGVASPATEVVLVNQPAWMSHGLANHIQHIVTAELNNADILDSTSLERAVAVLHNEPWISNVHRVERSSDTRVLVHATYRQPTVLVRDHDDTFHLVDNFGVLLPGSYSREEASRVNLPLIVGVAAKPGRPGRIWPGNDLQSGLTLAQMVSGYSFSNQILAIDVSKRDRQGCQRLALHTRGGMVRWGYTPGQEQAIEPDTHTKLQRLTNLYQQYGYIAPRGQMIDIFGSQILAHTLSNADREVLVGYTWTR